MSFVRLFAAMLGVVFAFAGVAQADGKNPLERFPADNAHQGVAIDEQHAYTINNTAVSKYNRFTGGKVAEWKAQAEHNIIHFNAGMVHEGKLYLAHSNYPFLPMRSSVEIFDTETLTHVGRNDFGKTDGSLTWVDWHNGAWWACFAHYSKRGGNPEKGHEHTRFVQYDADWNEVREWAFPPEVLEKFAPYSASGGAWIKDDLLLVTGHNLPEVYILRMPQDGRTLGYVTTVPVPFHGQAVDYNPDMGTLIYGIIRREKTVVTIPVAEVLSAVKNTPQE